MEKDGMKRADWVRVDLFILPFQAKEVERLSAKMGITKSEFIRQAIASHVSMLWGREREVDNVKVC